MTLGLDHWLRLLASILPIPAARRVIPPLDLMGLDARAIADLNLPPEVAGRLQSAQDAREQRRRLYR